MVVTGDTRCEGTGRLGPARLVLGVGGADAFFWVWDDGIVTALLADFFKGDEGLTDFKGTSSSSDEEFWTRFRFEGGGLTGDVATFFPFGFADFSDLTMTRAGVSPSPSLFRVFLFGNRSTMKLRIVFVTYKSNV